MSDPTYVCLEKLDTRQFARPSNPNQPRSLTDPTYDDEDDDYSPSRPPRLTPDPVPMFLAPLSGTVCWSCWGRKVVNNTINLPLTVGAKLAAKSTGAKCEGHKGMNVCYGARGWVAKLMPKGGITLGGTIIFKKQKADISAEFLAHEVSHGSQFALAGLTGPLTYAVAYGASALAATVTKSCSLMERFANHGRRFGCG